MRQEILELIENNSKLGIKEIAIMLNLDENKVKKGIKDMEDEGIILQYGTLINWDKVKRNDTVTALIDVKVTPQREVGFDGIAAKICKYPEVQSVSLMSGAYDFSVSVKGKDLKEVADFVGQKLATIEGVQSTTTNFLLKKYKESHVTLEDNEKDRRQVIIP